MRIGILKHDYIGEAERCLARKGRQLGHEVIVIDPREISLGESLGVDVLLGRPELSSFSELIFGAYLATFHACRLHGIPVVNSEDFMVLGQDKFLTHLAILKYLKDKRANPDFMPETFLFLRRDLALEEGRRMLDRFGGCVLKDPHSGRGQGVYLARTEDELKNLLHGNFPPGHLLLVQQALEKERGESGNYRDIRVWVSRDPDNKRPIVYGAYYRNATKGGFLTNISSGGTVSPIERVDNQIQTICEQVLDAVKGDVAGIDLVRDHSGHL